MLKICIIRYIAPLTDWTGFAFWNILQCNYLANNMAAQQLTVLTTVQEVFLNNFLCDASIHS